MRDFRFVAKKKKKKNTKKLRRISWIHISGTAGAIPFKFGMYKVLYMVALKYVEMVEISTIGFEL